MMVPLSLSHMSLSGTGFALVFATPDRRRVLPVGISLPEAQAFLHPRSAPHDLSKRFLDMLECRVDHVELRELRKGVAICRIVTTLPQGGHASLDARVGDAAALAVRTNAPFFVEDAILAKIGLDASSVRLPESKESDADEVVPPAADVERLAEVCHRLNDAVAHEEYEEAAKLRDEARRLFRHAHRNG